MQCIWVSSFSVIAKGELDLATVGRLLQRGWLRCSLRFLPKRIFLRTGNLLCQKGLLWTLPSSGTLEDVVILLTELVSAAPHLYQPGPGLSQRAPDQQDSQLEGVSEWELLHSGLSQLGSPLVWRSPRQVGQRSQWVSLTLQTLWGILMGKRFLVISQRGP